MSFDAMTILLDAWAYNGVQKQCLLVMSSDGCDEHSGCAAVARNRPTSAALAQGLARGAVCIAGVGAVLQLGAVVAGAAGGTGAGDALDSSNYSASETLLTRPAHTNTPPTPPTHTSTHTHTHTHTHVAPGKIFEESSK